MADLNVFGKFRSKQDFDRAEQEFQLRKQAALARSTGQDPAAIKVANEIQKARASGDTQRLNDIITSAKMFDRGVVTDAYGNPVEMSGYGQAVGGIEAAKAGMSQQAEKNVDLNMDPKITGAETTAKMEAEALEKAQQEFPKIQDQAQQMSDLIEQIKTSPGLKSVVGVPNPLGGRIPFIGNIAGSPAADFQAKLDQLGGKQFLEAFEALKGGGQITQIEGEKATNAIARMQISQSEAEFVKALDELQLIVNAGLERAQGKAAIPQMPVGQFSAPQEQSPAMPPPLPLSNFQKAEQQFNQRKSDPLGIRR